MEATLSKTSYNPITVDNKIATLGEILDLHNSLEFQQVIYALKESIQFAVHIAGEQEPGSDKAYYFEHMISMADAMHYISSIENILNTSKEIEIQ